MRIGSAVDGENYYVIRASSGKYLCISGWPQREFQHGELRGATHSASTAICVWGDFPSAAQWYSSMPDRVHIFNQEGVFQADWMRSLDAALEIIREVGGFLVYMNGEYDLPFTHEVFVPPRVKVPTPPRTAWARVLDDE